MRPEQLRAVLQVAFLCLLMPMLYLFGVGCFCFGGGTGGYDKSNSSPELHAYRRGRGWPASATVNRSHSLEPSTFGASAGEAQVINQALPGSFIGLLVPTAPMGANPAR